MTGAPIIGVMALSGSMELLPGTTVRILHRSRYAGPCKQGNWQQLFVVGCSEAGAQCGTARPIKEIGPQKAVVAAVRMPVQRSMAIRTLLTRTPRFAAYDSPSSNAFRGLIRKIDPSSPQAANITNQGSFSMDTPVKSPIPQSTN